MGMIGGIGVYSAAEAQAGQTCAAFGMVSTCISNPYVKTPAATPEVKTPARVQVCRVIAMTTTVFDYVPLPGYWKYVPRVITVPSYLCSFM